MRTSYSNVSGRLSYNRPLTTIKGLSKAFVIGFPQVSHAVAIPLTQYLGLTEEPLLEEERFSLWLYLSVAAILVLLGGAFAGLTIALMGQDGVYLQVIATSGEGKEQRYAQSVYKLLQRGKHWVLVTLLLSNVIVNETLPIVLDRSLGGGWPAVLGSTVLIVIFGEVIPQSVCVRYGLSIGAYMAPCVLSLMWILAPIAWPIAKLLDKLLGEDHGTVYKKSGLKTLVTLHKTLGASPTERLTQDEVTIISAVLDLKDKAVGDIMTPIDDVFTMSEDTVLDEETINTILSAGYSRIPIYQPGNPKNFVGMLLVKILITYDPEDCKKVSEFALATLPETRPETSCLDIVNFFQEGKSHMVLVSEYPAENYGAIGVVTLEDVIEELIGEEIIDESDVYIDVHKAIRRLAPAPKARALKGQTISNNGPNMPEPPLIDLSESNGIPPESSQNNLPPFEHSNVSVQHGTSPKTTFIRKGSGSADGMAHITVRGNTFDMREHLKHLGPSNLASHPKVTRYSSVKIKSGSQQGRSTIKPDLNVLPEAIIEESYHGTIVQESLPINLKPNPASSDLHEALLIKSRGKGANSSIQAVDLGYGSIGSVNYSNQGLTFDGAKDASPLTRISNTNSHPGSDYTSAQSSTNSESNIFLQPSAIVTRSRKKRRNVLSGSITENIIEAGGIQKLVLETNSSGEDLEYQESFTSKIIDPRVSLERINSGNSQNGGNGPPVSLKSEGVKKNRRRNRKKKASSNQH
ncbi:hypothetical protein K3495_g10157 [Podosphaera aphanis]|nr:hypothetical protein K3495_g10157 [Podosphaera aphanis]